MTTTTAAGRRQQARFEYDAFLARCPSRQLLDMVGNKWVGLVLAALRDGPLRHGQLGRQIAGISQKMLTQTLRGLEQDGLITRTVTPSVPVRVDYALTPLGRDLSDTLQPLKAWAEANMPVVLENRARSAST